MNEQEKNRVLQSMIELLELPDSAYEKAVSRYQDLGEWLCRDGSICSEFEPHIFSQGSFCFGTAIRPLDEKEEYDLDLACRLVVGVTKDTHTQEQLKDMVGYEIESYRVARGIQEATEPKHRCWRLIYADKISFHMDIVPCIPEMESKRQSIREAMLKVGTSNDLAESASRSAVSITDDRHPGYRRICNDWQISNPEGYASWFEDRMRQTQIVALAEARVDDIPLYKRKLPLQRIIQLLKRHRDEMFKGDPDVKPISIIITTLAARAYQGESDIESALRNVLSRMGRLVGSTIPRIPNPVDPNEDFADRWSMPECAHLKLEDNFWNWLTQAKADFEILLSSDDANFITKQAKHKFLVSMDADTLRKRLGLAPTSVVVTPKTHRIAEETAKPWRRRDR